MPDEIITNNGETKKIELTISEINFIYHMLDRFPIQGVETVLITNNFSKWVWSCRWSQTRKWSVFRSKNLNLNRSDTIS